MKQLKGAEMDNKLKSLSLGSNDVESEWAIFKDMINTAAPVSTCIVLQKIILTTKHSWMRNSIFTDLLSLVWHPPPKKVVFSNIMGTIQWKLCQMWDSLLSRKAEKIQFCADQDNMEEIALKIVYGPTTSGSFPLLSADGNILITDK